MRRYTFYLLVALLAFGIGSFVFNLYPNRAEQFVNVQNIQADKPEISENKTILPNVEDKVLNDEEKAAFDVLKPTIRRWLRGERIKNEFTDASNESIEEITGKDRLELSEGEINWYASFRFEPTLIDVDGDGKNELAIKNDCAPVGNCQFWVFKKKGNGYKIILKTLPGAVQTFKLKAAKTNGYFDLETKDHGTASSGGIDVYKFDGQKYLIKECYKLYLFKVNKRQNI